MKIAENPFGPVQAPPGVGSFDGGNLSGLEDLLTIVLRTLIVGAGIYAVINLVLAGYAFLGASGDPKRIADATAKIWHSIIGLIIAAGAFVLAGIVGEILFGDANALLRIKYFTPTP